MSSCPLSSNSRATVAKATSSSASPSSRRTSSRGRGRLEERVGVHAAVDGEELLGPADAGGQRLRGHRVANADDRVTPPGRPALERDVEPVLERRLERPERHAVDRVHDRRHALVPGRGPAEDARLRAVRVHDLGLRAGGMPLAAAGRPSSRPRAGSAGPARASPRPSGPAAAARSKRSPSGPSAGPVIKRHVVVIVMVQAVDRQQRVFLGTAQDQPRDDVDNPHADLVVVSAVTVAVPRYMTTTIDSGS